jgi:hypothetical protein
MHRRGLLLFCVFFEFGSLWAPEKRSAQPSADSWAANMQGMAEEVKALVPYVYSSRRYSDPANRGELAKHLKAFAKSVHSVPEMQGKKILGDDPIVSFSLYHLEADANRASSAFALGRVEYSRDVAKSVMNHCFRCHSMAKMGGSAQWKISSFEKVQMNPVEKADLMVATRDYDAAFASMKASLENFGFAQERPFEYETLMKKYLSLTIRQRSESGPEEAITLFSKIDESKQVPDHLKHYVATWLASLEDLGGYLKKNKKPSSTYAMAQSLLRQGRDKQSYFKDHSGDVEFLRAAQSLHRSLLGQKSPAQKSKAYLLLGETYEVLDELGYWGLHEVYYESCVRTSPKTQLSKTCYHRLKNSILLGYSGSSGTHLPREERERLKELQKLVQ